MMDRVEFYTDVFCWKPHTWKFETESEAVRNYNGCRKAVFVYWLWFKIAFLWI